jgi:hypothetical protein
MMEPPNGRHIGHLSQPIDIFLVVVLIGGMIGVLVGFLLGLLVGELTVRKVSRIVILVVCSGLACASVFWLAHANELSELAMYACIPTVVTCSVLERWTRPREEPPIPTAAVC